MPSVKFTKAVPGVRRRVYVLGVTSMVSIYIYRHVHGYTQAESHWLGKKTNDPQAGTKLKQANCSLLGYCYVLSYKQDNYYYSIANLSIIFQHSESHVATI